MLGLPPLTQSTRQGWGTPMLLGMGYAALRGTLEH
jgi:hypothetical protein